jgi:hypothetical protein
VSSDNPTAEDALVRAMCNASPSAMVGSGQPPSPQENPVGQSSQTQDSCLCPEISWPILIPNASESAKASEPRQRARSALLLQMQKDAYTAFLQADVAPKNAPTMACKRPSIRLPHRLAQWFCGDEVCRVQPRQARFRRRECQTRGLTFASAARQGAADHL